ncbi:response regulator transcription factor [Georgenia muralis]
MASVVGAHARAVVLASGDDLRRELGRVLARLGLDLVCAASATEVMRLDGDAPAVAVLEVEAGAFMVCRRLHDRFGESLPVIMVSATRTEPQDRVAGFLVGADDYLTVPLDADEALCRVRRSLLRDARRSVPSPGLAALTVREAEVLDLLVAGYTQKQIATRLDISGKTVGTHIQHLLTKLDLHSRTDAIALAIRAGLNPQGPGTGRQGIVSLSA